MRIFRLLVALPLAFSLSAQPLQRGATPSAPDEVSFRYRIGSVAVDPKLNPNAENLARLEQILGEKASTIQRIELRASSSPDGPYAVNARYAHERAEWLKQSLSERFPAVPASVWQVEEVAEDWDGVADYLRRSTEPYKNEAVQIVRNASPNRKELLQDLYAGEAWDDLYKYAFPWLRAVKLRIYYSETGARPEEPATPPTPERVFEPIVAEGSVPVYFNRSSAALQQDFSGNAAQIARIRQEVAAGADSLALVSYASPEGTEAVNMSFSKRRSAAVRDFLSKQTGIPANRISVRDLGEDWDGFEKAVNASYEGADREEVLRILRGTLQPAEKEAALKKLDGGRTWQSLIRNQMAELRRVEVFALKAPKTFVVETPPEPVPEEPVYEEEQEEEPVVEEQVEEQVVEEEPVEEVVEEEVVEEVEEVEEEPEQQEEVVEVPEIEEVEPEVILEVEEKVTPSVPVRKPYFAIGTNLLYDAATAFNLGVEVPVSHHWTIYLDGIYNNMPFSGGRKIDLKLGEAGAAYYFNDNGPYMKGWLVSAGVGGGLYNLVGEKKGWEGYIGYLTLGGGYSFQLGTARSPWRLKLAGGLGPIHTAFKLSERNAAGDMVHKMDNTFTWQLPSNLQVSLIYLFQGKEPARNSR